MENKVIIIELIKEDMRFNQYIGALRKLGIEVYDFNFDIINVIAKLMNKGDEEITDSWAELYSIQLMECQKVAIEPLGKNLYPLAEECYNSLLNFKT